MFALFGWVLKALFAPPSPPVFFYFLTFRVDLLLVLCVSVRPALTPPPRLEALPPSPRCSPCPFRSDRRAEEVSSRPRETSSPDGAWVCRVRLGNLGRFLVSRLGDRMGPPARLGRAHVLARWLGDISCVKLGPSTPLSRTGKESLSGVFFSYIGPEQTSTGTLPCSSQPCMTKKKVEGLSRSIGR